MNQNQTIVKILGAVAVLSILGAVVLAGLGKAEAATITAIVGVGSGAVGNLGGALRGSADTDKKDGDA